MTRPLGVTAFITATAAAAAAAAAASFVLTGCETSEPPGVVVQHSTTPNDTNTTRLFIRPDDGGQSFSRVYRFGGDVTACVVDARWPDCVAR